MKNRASLMERREHVGNRLKAARLAREQTIKDFADYANMHWRDYIRVEAGKAVLPAEGLYSLAEKTNLNPRWIMTGHGAVEITNELEVSINVARTLYELVGETRQEISGDDFEDILRQAIQVGFDRGELTREDIKELTTNREYLVADIAE
jgi:transcriptional regulator with XRE-family HTH domain